MQSRAVVLLTLLALGSASFAGEGFDSPRHPSVTDEPPVRRLTVDPPSTNLEVGDEAPTFSYLAPDGAWHQASEFFSRGAVVLVFGARSEELLAIEKDRDRFLEADITPVMVLDMRSSSTASYARRLRLSGPIVADPRRAIAGIYNSLDRNTLRHAPSFFVVDEKGMITSIGHGPLPTPRSLLAESARSLGREGVDRSAVRN